MTDQHDLREAIDFMKAQSGTGSKQRKQEKFCEVYTANVGQILAGERYDDAGVGASTARSAVGNVFGGVPDYEDTLSEGLAVLDTDGERSLRELVQDLDEIADLSGNEQQDALEEALTTHAEPSLVTLALLADEKFGLGTSQMREAFVPDMDRSERKRAEALCDGTVNFITRANAGTLPTEPQLFQAFDPMLAKPESAGEPDNVVGQVKIDGHRIVVHVKDGEARAYTRQKNDVTHSLPELQDISWPAGSYIFDGEVIAEDGTYKSTSERVGKKPKNIDHDNEMHFALFDLLHKNGTDYTRKPFKKRHNKLKQITMQAVDDHRVYHLAASSNIDAVKQHARNEGYEGIILKNLHAPYELGTRSSNWVKSKNTAETIDVRIVDFIEGDGRHSGTLGALRVESKDGEPLGKVGTGFTDAERNEIWQNRGDWLGGTVELLAEAYDDGLRFPVYERGRRRDGEPDSIEKITAVLSEP